MDKHYLGDGVYVVWEDEAFTLTTEFGTGVPTNRIVMEVPVYEAFLRWADRLHKVPRPVGK